MRLAPGHVIDGRYTVERLLGQGGMGAVYVALEEGLGRRVAIKILLPEAAKHPDAVARFEREGRAAAALESHHVTRIFGVGRLENGSPYIVMELLDGQDLAHALEKRGPLPIHEVVNIVVDACDAVAEAHARGIVHRDLKPPNLFLAQRANGTITVKVLDFGISKATGLGAPTQGLTATTAMMGTPYYMSPEQVREARVVDARTDIWALGATMYELITGDTPFNGATLADLCVAICHSPHAPMSSRRADVPRELEAIVDRCLSKDPAHRFASALELAEALRRIGAIAMTRNEPARLVPTPHPAYTPQPAQTPGPYTPPPTARPVIAPTAAMTVDPLTRTTGDDASEVPVKKVSLALVAVAALVVGVVGVLVLFTIAKLRAPTDMPTAASATSAPPGSADVRDAAAQPTTTIAPLPSAPATPLPPPARPVIKPTSHAAPVASPPSAPVAVVPVPVPVVVPVPVAVPPASATQKPVTLPAGPPPIPADRR